MNSSTKFYKELTEKFSVQSKDVVAESNITSHFKLLSKYIRPSVVLASRYEDGSGIFRKDKRKPKNKSKKKSYISSLSDDEDYDTEASDTETKKKGRKYEQHILRKYYGRKVIDISTKAGVVRAITHCKYIKAIESKAVKDEKEPNRNWLRQKAKTGVRGKNRQNIIKIRSLGDLVLSSRITMIESLSFRRFLSNSFRNVSIRLIDIKENDRYEYTYGPNKKTKQDKFQTQNLVLSRPRRPYMGDVFSKIFTRTIKLLRTHPASTSNHYSLQNSTFSPESFVELLCTQSVKSLELDLTAGVWTEEQRTQLLTKIHEYGVSKWYVKIKCEGSSDNFTDNKELESVFSLVDTLGLNTSLDDEGETYEYPMPILKDLPEVIEKNKRVLDLHSSGDIFLSRTLRHFKSLENLYISSLVECLHVIEEKSYRGRRVQVTHKGKANTTKKADGTSDKHESTVIFWPTNFKHLTLNVNTSSDNSETKFDSLIEHFKQKNPQLQSMEIFYCFTHLWEDEDPDIHEIPDHNHDLLMKVERLSEFEHLKDLTLSYSGSDAYDERFEALQNELQFMPQLEKLHVKLGTPENPICWDVDFPFNYLMDLKELQITISPDWKGPEWGERLAANIRKMPNLTVFDIKDDTETRMSLRTFTSIMGQIPKLKNAKRINLVTIVQSLHFQEKLTDLVAVCLRWSQEKELDAVKERMRSYVNENKDLEVISIGELRGFSFDRIDYKRGYNINMIV